VVASTDVWGDIAKQVGGSAVQVTSIISDPSKDPHEYEASPRDQLAVSRAAILVENGGGYDDFMSRMSSVAPNAALVDVATVSGKNQHPATGDFNEHLWYDFPTVRKVAARLAALITEEAPKQRAAVTRNLQRFDTDLAGLQRQESTIRRSAQGKGVAITEPVPLYMTDALGLINRTPTTFSHAIEDGADVAPAVLQAQLHLFTQRRVAVLAYNEQTSGPTTQQVLTAAKHASIPVVGVRETLPPDHGYLAWMHDDLDAFQAALQG
jgi:zinc/manganese transport system substrate-binding protein